MNGIVDAYWAEGLADADGESRFWEVGKPVWQAGKPAATITRITVQDDLPGLHCNMRRVCVWAGDALLAEAPLHNLQAVGYLISDEAEA